MRTCQLGLGRGLSSLVALLLLVACGGGGGGGGSAAIVYAGNTDPAIITPTNASQLTANVIGSDDATALILGVSSESSDAMQDRGSGAMDLAMRLNRNFRETLVRVGKANSAQQAVRAVIPVDESVSCDSGSVRTTGTLNDNGTGTLSMSFNDCRMGDGTLTGPATVRVDAFNFAYRMPTDFTVSFSRLTLRGPGVSVDVGGSLRAQLVPGFPSTETITQDVVSQDNNTGRMTKTENLVFVMIQNSPPSFNANVSGRVFDQVHGYVDITTVTPLAFSATGQLFPNSGQVVLTGAGNSSIRATALSATLAKLELDLNGDSVFENVATLKWTDLTGPVGADLADSDGDGMHNSWEVASGLKKDDPADAASDMDGDNASNLVEYNAGTGANDANSTPAPVNVSILASDSPDPVASSSNLTYSITVSNSSGLAANNVMLTDTLPAGVNLVSATTSQGTCSGSNVVTCNLGTLNGFGNVFVTIVVATGAAGLISNTAAVTTSSFDPNTADNTVTSTTTVG